MDIRYKVLWIGEIAKHKGIGETKVLRNLNVCESRKCTTDSLIENPAFLIMGELIMRNWMVMESEIRRMNDSG